MRFIDHVCYIRPPLPECTHEGEGRCEECRDNWRRYSEKTAAVAQELKEMAGRHNIPFVLSKTYPMAQPHPVDNVLVPFRVRCGIDAVDDALEGGVEIEFEVLKNRG
jgi:hypothetical protein